jgi:hypothetical protein
MEGFLLFEAREMTESERNSMSISFFYRFAAVIMTLSQHILPDSVNLRYSPLKSNPVGFSLNILPG